MMTTYLGMLLAMEFQQVMCNQGILVNTMDLA